MHVFMHVEKQILSMTAIQSNTPKTTKQWMDKIMSYTVEINTQVCFGFLKVATLTVILICLVCWTIEHVLTLMPSLEI